MNILFLIWLLLPLFPSKLLQNSFNIMKFNSHSFQFLLKQTLSLGSGSFLLKARFSSKISHPDPPLAIPLDIAFYTDIRWNKMQQINENDLECKEKTSFANDIQQLPLPSNGDWSFKMEVVLNQTTRPFIWYFFLTDCGKIMPQYTDSRNRIEIELEVLNSNNSHLSYEYTGKMVLNFMGILGYVLLLLSVKKKLFKVFTMDSEDFFGKPPAYFIIGAMVTEVLALGFENGYIYQMEYNGVGGFWLEFLGVIFSVFSQFLIVSLCVLMAAGWSLNRKKLEDWEMYVPLFSVIILFEIAIISIDRALFENNFVLHDYEGFAMNFILGIRVIYWVNLMFLIIKSIYELKEQGGNPLLERFFRNFGILSSTFILGLPAVVLGTNYWVPEYFQHKFLGICNFSIQFITISVFLIMFEDANSLYNKVRIKKKSLQNLPVSLKND